MTNLKSLENTARYRKTKKGLVTNLYHKLKSRNLVDFDLDFLKDFSNCKKFNRLFNEWVKSGYNKQFIPSIDRISNKTHYTKENIQWLTWAENRHKQTIERRCRKGKVAKIMGNKVICIYNSQREAVLKNGLTQSNISSVLNGKRTYCGGYKWAYVSNNTEVGNIYEHPHLINKI